MSNNWPTTQEKEERAGRRATLIAGAFARGNDPVQALIEHDENLPPAERKGKRLNNPTHPERIGGASPRAVATHRLTTALETVEVRSTLDHLLKYAEDKKLGRNVIDVLSRIINGYLKPPATDGEDDDGDGEAALVRTRDALEASKLALGFYKDSREFIIKRGKLEGEQSAPEVETLEGLAATVDSLMNRANELTAVLAIAHEPQEDDDV